MKIFDDIDQGTAEWWEVRKGVPTASNFRSICTAKTGDLSDSRFLYMFKMIEDVAKGGDPEHRESYTSKAMQNGIDTEPEARAFYKLKSSLKVDEVGFCMDRLGHFGCSPDGLVDDPSEPTPGGLELKCPTLRVHAEYLHNGVLPPAYKQQVHGSMIVTERLWWDFMSYAPPLPPLIIRVRRDEYTTKLQACMSTFWDEWSEIKKRKSFSKLFNDKKNKETQCQI